MMMMMRPLCMCPQSCTARVGHDQRVASGSRVYRRESEEAMMTRAMQLAGLLAVCRGMLPLLAMLGLAVWLSQPVCAMVPASMMAPVRLLEV
jgi:hypothetical protein